MDDDLDIVFDTRLMDVSKDNSSLENKFLIEAIGTYLYMPIIDGEEDWGSYENWTSDVFDRVFVIDSDQLLSNDGEISRQTAHEILVSMHCPFENWMINRIIDFAHENSKNFRFGYNVVRFTVFADIIVPVEMDNEEHMAVSSSSRFAAAAVLEQVKVQEWIDTTCSICLEEFEIGSFATQMPCNASRSRPGKPHLFHKNCIQRWLERNNVCPLCRSTVFR